MALVHTHEACIADGDSEDIARKVAQHRILARSEGFAEGAPLALPCLGGNQGVEVGMALFQLFGKAQTDHGRELLHWHEEVAGAVFPGRSVGGDSPASDQHVHMRMMAEEPGPGMQHRQDAHLRADESALGGEFSQRLGGGLHQDPVENLLVAQEKSAELSWHGGDDMEVVAGQHLDLPCGHPVCRLSPMALRAGTVSATMIVPEGFVAVVAAISAAAHLWAHASGDIPQRSAMRGEHTGAEFLFVAHSSQ